MSGFSSSLYIWNRSNGKVSDKPKIKLAYKALESPDSLCLLADEVQRYYLQKRNKCDLFSIVDGCWIGPVVHLETVVELRIAYKIT